MRKVRESYPDQIRRAFRKAAKAVDAPAMLYYEQRMNACVSFERFRGSWAGQQWMAKHFPGE